MNRIGLVIMGGVVAFFAMIALIGVGSYVSAANYGNRMEKTIQATWENNENVLAQYSNRIAEMAQVPEMQRDDLKEVYRDAMTGRYGQDGSKAVFQWLQEQNPQLNNEIYTRLQVSMESGRKDFEVAQTTLIDQKRSYETELGFVWRGFWLRVAGYPKIDLSKYKVITNNYANEAFETGVENGLTIRKKD